jgi:hypothetical protein
MRIIPPHKVTSQLLEVIQDAKKELVLVSPYVDIKYWKVVARALATACTKGVQIDFYIRHDHSHTTSKANVEALGITPILVENLHAKFYYNETGGVITSMNLLASSNSNSIEIGCQVETPEELNELRLIVEQHLAPNKPVVPKSVITAADVDEDYGGLLFAYLEDTFDCELQVDDEEDNEGYAVRALSNQFYINVEQPNNKLVLRGVISGREAERYRSQSHHYLTFPNLVFKLDPGTDGNYTMIRGTYTQPLSSAFFNKLPIKEGVDLLPIIADFIDAVRKFKDG